MAEPDANPRLGHSIDTSVGGETVRAFAPPPLPPHPPIDTLALLDRLSLAERALGRLDGITLLNPRTTRFSPLRSGPASPSCVDGPQLARVFFAFWLVRSLAVMCPACCRGTRPLALMGSVD